MFVLGVFEKLVEFVLPEYNLGVGLALEVRPYFLEKMLGVQHPHQRRQKTLKNTHKQHLVHQTIETIKIVILAHHVRHHRRNGPVYS